jgi:hypothetical protein
VRTEIWGSQLRKDEEKEDGEEKKEKEKEEKEAEEKEEEEEKEKEKATLIKSRDPHLAGGEKWMI